jgi:hypothetical protein
MALSATAKNEFKILAILIFIIVVIQSSRFIAGVPDTPHTSIDSSSFQNWANASSVWLSINGYWLFLIPLGVAFDRVGLIKTIAFLFGLYGISMILIALKPSPDMLWPLHLVSLITFIALQASPLLVVVVGLIRNIRSEFFTRFFVIAYLFATGLWVIHWLWQSSFELIGKQFGIEQSAIYIYARYTLLSLLLCFALIGLYRKKRGRSTGDTIYQPTLTKFSDITANGVLTNPAFWIVTVIFLVIAMVPLTNSYLTISGISAAYAIPSSKVFNFSSTSGNSWLYALLFPMTLFLGAFIADRAISLKLFFIAVFGVLAVCCAIVLPTLIPISIIVPLAIFPAAFVGVLILCGQFKLVSYFKPSPVLGTICGVMLTARYLGSRLTNELTPRYNIQPGSPAPHEYEIALYIIIVLSLATIFFIHKTWKHIENIRTEVRKL